MDGPSQETAESPQKLTDHHVELTEKNKDIATPLAKKLSPQCNCLTESQENPIPPQCTSSCHYSDCSRPAPQSDDMSIGNDGGHDYGCSLSVVFMDFIVHIISIITYVTDIGSDIWLVVVYAQSGHWWWFGWTLAFVVVAGLALAIANVKDCELEDKYDPLHITHSSLRWVVKIVVMFSLTLPIVGWVYYQLHWSFSFFSPEVDAFLTRDHMLIFFNP